MAKSLPSLAAAVEYVSHRLPILTVEFAQIAQMEPTRLEESHAPPMFSPSSPSDSCSRARMSAQIWASGCRNWDR